jgi:hypothetical protein
VTIPVNLNDIVSSVTLLVAFLALWFSSLRGPAIDFLKSTAPTYQKIAEHPTFVPANLYLNRLDLIVANNGSRGGLVSAVRIESKMNPWFAPFFVRLAYSADPVQIAAGESELMPVTCSIVLTSWKWYPTTLDPSLKFLDAVRKELNQNRESFSKFVVSVATGNPLGVLEVYLTLTRKTVRTQLHEEKVTEIQLPPLDTGNLAVFTWAQQTWDERSPSESDIVIESLRQLANLRGSIQQVIDGYQFKLAGFQVAYADEWYYDDTSTPTNSNPRRAMISWSSDFDKAMKHYIEQAKIFNLAMIRKRNLSTTDQAENDRFDQAVLEILEVVKDTLKAMLNLEQQIRTSL